MLYLYEMVVCIQLSYYRYISRLIIMFMTRLFAYKCRYIYLISNLIETAFLTTALIDSDSVLLFIIIVNVVQDFDEFIFWNCCYLELSVTG